jgi:hypothetical protein
LKTNNFLKSHFSGKDKSNPERKENEFPFTAPDEETNNSVTVDYNNPISEKLPDNSDSMIM